MLARTFLPHIRSEDNPRDNSFQVTRSCDNLLQGGTKCIDQ